jgi:hypothetical protein
VGIGIPDGALVGHKGQISAGVRFRMTGRLEIYSVYISMRVAPSGFFMAIDAILRSEPIGSSFCEICVMAFAADYAILFDRLDEELRIAPAPGLDLFAKIIAGVCTRIPVLSKSGKAGKIDRLIECGAWTEAALALIEFELPAWKVRRLVCESGQWLCSLSRQPNLPLEIDDTADASHDVLPLAILCAFIEARRRVPTAYQIKPADSQPDLALSGVICCENFA